jgi:hypothetical protein
MEIIRIQTTGLVAYARGFAGRRAGPVPITPWRAASQVNNPSVLPDDVLLLVAMDDERMAGYLGILPAGARDQKAGRLFWNTCFWVDAAYGAKVSMALLQTFLNYTGNHVLFSDLSERTAAVIERLPGFTVSSRKGILLRLRPSLAIRTQSIVYSGKAPPLIRLLAYSRLAYLADTLLRPVFFLRRFKAKSQCASSQELVVADHPSADLISFIKTMNTSGPVMIDMAVAEWWTRGGWLAEPGKANQSIAKDYYFSSIAIEHHYRWFMLTDMKGIKAAGVFSSRDGLIKTHYVWATKDSEEALFSALTGYLLNGKNYHTILSYQEKYLAFLSRAFNYKKPYLKRFTALPPGMEGIELQDGDGDYIFT